MILVSACLLGSNCKYSGGNNSCPAVRQLLSEEDFIPFCPEQAAGLSTPRLPCELCGARVFNSAGEDMTEAFVRGAQAALALCREKGVTRAVLKESSPSCGCHTVYDGTFSGTKIPGMGLTARLLAENGIAVMSENDV